MTGFVRACPMLAGYAIAVFGVVLIVSGVVAMARGFPYLILAGAVVYGVGLGVVFFGTRPQP